MSGYGERCSMGSAEPHISRGDVVPQTTAVCSLSVPARRMLTVVVFLLQDRARPVLAVQGFEERGT